MLTKLRSAIYGAKDLASTKAFYAALLGATRIGDTREVGGGISMAVVADPSGNHLGLISVAEQEKVKS